MRELTRCARERAQHRSDRDTTRLADARERRRRHMPLGGIGHHTKSREGQVARGGKACRNMRFHVGDSGARGDMQGAFIGRRCHRIIDARHVDDRRAAERGRKPLRPGAIAFVLFAVFRNDGTGNECRARTQSRRKAAGDAEAQHRADIGFEHIVERRFKQLSFAAAGDHRDIGTRRDPRLGLHAGDGEDDAAVELPARVVLRLARYGFGTRRAAQAG